MTAIQPVPFSSAAVAALFSIHPIARAAHIVLLSALTATAAFAQAPAPVARPAAASVARPFDIPAGPLAPAISRFAATAGVGISFDATQLKGLQSPRLQGSYTVDQGFAQLLRGSGWEAEHRGGGNYALRMVTVQPAPATGPTAAESIASLPVVVVKESSQSPGDLPKPYAGGQVARGGRVGLLGDRDFMDTPFNVTNYTAEGFQNQQARNIGDVVKNDPSVRTIWPDGSYINQFTIRGFPTQTQDMAVNGLYGIVPPQMTGGLEFVERVEILKGPSALLNGMAPTGGIGGNINLVTKRAADTPITQLTTSYYSDAQAGAHIDVGRRFGEDNSLGVRINGAYRDGRTGVDDQSQRAGSAALKLDYRGERLRVSADVGYHDMATDAPSRVVFTDNANFQIPAAPKGTLSLGQPWYFAKSNDQFEMLQGEFDISPDLTVFAAAGARKNEFLGLYNFIYLQNDQGAFRANQYFQPTFSDTRTALAGLRGRFITGPVRHEVNLNVTTLHIDSGVLAPVISTYVSNINNPSYIAQPSLAAYKSTAPKTSESDLKSFALADTVYFLDDRIQLTIGVRQQKIQTQNFNATNGAVTSAYDQDRLSPAAGLVVKPWKDTTLYANYVEGLSQGPTAPTGTINVGTMFPPVRSMQSEMGIKHDFGMFAATVSAFQIRQPSGMTDASTNVYSLDGEQRNRGVEVNVFGEPLRGIRILGGVTFMRGVLTKTANGTYDGNEAIGVPNTQFNLGAEWDTPLLPGFTTTGRLIHTSSQYYNAANTQSIPSWTRLDIGARYKTMIAGTPATIRASVENLLDKDYWAAASGSYGLARGAPRTFLLSSTFDF